MAVLDKSTTGKLLASRLRREPGLRVGKDLGGLADPDPWGGPGRRDGLWDRELDG